MPTIQPLLFDDIARREERRKVTDARKIIGEFYLEVLAYLKRGKANSAKKQIKGKYDPYVGYWDTPWYMEELKRFYRIGTPKILWNSRGLLIDPLTLNVYNESSPKAILGNLREDTAEDFFRHHFKFQRKHYEEMTPYLTYRYERWHPKTGKLKEGHKHSRLEQKSDDR